MTTTSQTDYVCIVDFEATCWKEKRDHEIIEFPAVLLAWEQIDLSIMSKKQKYKLREVSRIQLFVKPMTDPIVSDFCHQLTGITQKQVDHGMPLLVAIATHLKWLNESLPSGSNINNRVTILTHGDWDLGTMLPMDIKNINDKQKSDYKLDEIYQRYVNIKDLFQKVTREKGKGMAKMLSFLKLKLEGRHHSGIDDCHNIARMFIKLVSMGVDKKMFMNSMKYVGKVKYLDDFPDDLTKQANENFDLMFEFDQNL